MHLPRAHRTDAAAVSEQLARGIVDLKYERTQNEAADIGTTCFTDPLAWTKALYLVNIVSPQYWQLNNYEDYLWSLFSDGLPQKPGGILKPRIGPMAKRNPINLSTSGTDAKAAPSYACAAPGTNDGDDFCESSAPNPGTEDLTRVDVLARASTPSSQRQEETIITDSTASSAAVAQKVANKKEGGHEDAHRCKVVRLTENEDMTSETGKSYALKTVKDFNGTKIALWASMPCIGGSSWQHVNEQIYDRKGDLAKQKRLRGLRTLFRQLF
eukprot:7211457-Pyramimonas_sp.AAC.1